MQNAVLGTRGQAAEKSTRSLLSWNFQSSGNQQVIIQISALEHIAINALRERSWCYGRTQEAGLGRPL